MICCHILWKIDYHASFVAVVVDVVVAAEVVVGLVVVLTRIWLSI